MAKLMYRAGLLACHHWVCKY